MVYFVSPLFLFKLPIKPCPICRRLFFCDVMRAQIANPNKAPCLHLIKISSPTFRLEADAGDEALYSVE